jgi:GTP-binding protein
MLLRLSKFANTGRGKWINGGLNRRADQISWSYRQLLSTKSNPGGANSRNVAIIAHVDHGKTTLVDCLLRQTGFIGSDVNNVRVMDSNILEKERGITILSKCTSIEYSGHRINIVDTPGHADFGGEVERALTMVDGVILVVDATEGPMAQTRFVLSKALKRNLTPIVVQNKVDRESARCDEVDFELLDLFLSLNANDSQLNYHTVYASAREGWALPVNPTSRPDLFDVKLRKINGTSNMNAILDLIVSKIPPPRIGSQSLDSSFSLLVNSIESNQYVGKCVMGRIESGRISVGEKIKALKPDGTVSEENRVTRMFLRSGIVQVCNI